jgi:hypothetical protein
MVNVIIDEVTTFPCTVIEAATIPIRIPVREEVKDSPVSLQTPAMILSCHIGKGQLSCWRTGGDLLECTRMVTVTVIVNPVGS